MNKEEFLKILKVFIKSEMTNRCYIENKDYHWGDTEYNDNPTIYYKVVFDVPNQYVIKELLFSEFPKYIAEYFKDEGKDYMDFKPEIQIMKNAFNIDLSIFTYKILGVSINLMKDGELSSKIKEDPERWQFYIDNVKNNI